MKSNNFIPSFKRAKDDYSVVEKQLPVSRLR